MTRVVTTRSDAMRVTCPVCGSEPHVACSGRRGPRVACHAERHVAAVRAGAQPVAVHESHPELRLPRARWARTPFRCDGCGQQFQIGGMRVVEHGDEKFCILCWRKRAKT